MARDLQAEMAKRRENIARAQELHAQGRSYAEIGRELGVYAGTARGYVLDPDRKLGITGRPRWAEIVPIELVEPVWQRQKGETRKAYESFAVYRGMKEPRSMLRAQGASPGGHHRRMDWSKKYRWTERVRAWDAHVEELAIHAQEEAIVAMNEGHANIAVEGLKLVLARITGDDALGVRAIDASMLGPQDLARLTEVLTKLERLARGAETERVDNVNRPVEIKLSFNATPNIREDLAGVSLPDVIDAAQPRELPPAA